MLLNQAWFKENGPLIFCLQDRDSGFDNIYIFETMIQTCGSHIFSMLLKHGSKKMVYCFIFLAQRKYDKHYRDLVESCI